MTAHRAIALLVVLGLAACRPDPRDPGPEPLDPPPMVAPALPDDPFAPLLEVPPELEDDPATRLDVGFVRTAEVPTREEVGVPPYPTARILQTQPRGEVVLEDDRVETLPIVTLLTSDKPAQVVEFYRRALPGWRYEEILTQHWFWTEADRFSPLDRAGMSTPSVGIAREEPPTSPLMPDARTRIQIRYRPAP